MTRSAVSDSNQWSIIRNSIRGVQIKSKGRGLYLGKVESELVVRDQDNAFGDAFLWYLDPVHECKFIVRGQGVPLNIPLSIQMCSNGRAAVSSGGMSLPSEFGLSILEFSTTGVGIKEAKSGKYLGFYQRQCRPYLSAQDSPVDWNIQPEIEEPKVVLGLAPWMLPAAVRQNAPESWIGHQQPMECTFEMPPSLRRPFANWRCWPIDRPPSEVKVDADSVGNSVPTEVEITFEEDGGSTILDGQVSAAPSQADESLVVV